MNERVWSAQLSIWQTPHTAIPAVLSAKEDLFYSIATRPNSCKTNLGINTVSEVVFTSDFILLCVKGSPAMVYKPFQSAVPVLCCSYSSWN